LTERQFYSVGIKKTVTCKASDITLKKLKNGRFALRCKCPETKGQLTKFVAMDKVDDLKKKYKMERSSSKSPSKSPRKCLRGSKKSGGCKKKPGPKRTKPCKHGVKRSRACKKKPGPKRGSTKK
jgi:hypothetical protein